MPSRSAIRGAVMVATGTWRMVRSARKWSPAQFGHQRTAPARSSRYSRSAQPSPARSTTNSRSARRSWGSAGGVPMRTAAPKAPRPR
ncbi:hypothetical protein [Embleya sp. NBC_00896]|uniref:hypothetical protein n=1 Tax=Embleya sp. NBC_00896 TaxID=2975961 RepID=UPI0038673075